MDAISKAKPGGVLIGQGQRIGRDIDGIDGGFRPFPGQGKRNDATAGADIQDPGWFGHWQREEDLHQVLRLRPRNEGAGVAKEGAAVEVDRTEKVLERLAGGPAFHEVAQGVELAFAERAVEFQVEIDAFFPQDVREEQLGIEARAFDGVLLEVPSRGGNDLLNRFQQVLMKGDARPLARALGKSREQWDSARLCACSIWTAFPASVAI